MSSSRITKGYEALTAPERFRLATKAQARDDLVEFGRLQESCPRKHYRTRDWEYVERAHVAHCITLGFAIDISEALGKLQAVSVLALATEEDWVDLIRQRFMRNALDEMAAFDHLSRQYMGLEGVTLLAVYCRPVLHKLRALTEGCDYQGDPNAIICDELTEAWREVFIRFEPQTVDNVVSCMT